jgi:hypothetical protein
MKRTLLIFSAALTLCCQQMAAQGIAIRHTDGTFTTILTPDVDYITTVTEANTFIFGTWYLGYFKNENSTYHYDGTEFMTFAGEDLIWSRPNTKLAEYGLRFYGTTGKSPWFRATGKNGTTGQFNWYITKMTTDGEKVDEDSIALMYSMGIDLKIELKDGGSASINLGDESETGTWSEKDGQVTLTFDGENVTGRMSGENLVLTSKQDDTEITLSREKPSFDFNSLSNLNDN